MSAAPQTRLAFLAGEVLRLSDSPLGRELAAHVQAYLARPTDLQADLKRVRDKLAKRLYSPENEADVNALLEHLTAALAQLEGASVANCPEIPESSPEHPPEHPPEHVPSVPDEWNRTHLRAEMARIRDNVRLFRDAARPRPTASQWAEFLTDQDLTLDALARADNVIAAQAADLGAIRDGDYRDERARLRRELVDKERLCEKFRNELEGCASSPCQACGQEIFHAACTCALQRLGEQRDEARRSVRDLRKQRDAAEQARLATERELQELRARLDVLWPPASEANPVCPPFRNPGSPLYKAGYGDGHNAAMYEAERELKYNEAKHQTPPCDEFCPRASGLDVCAPTCPGGSGTAAPT